MSPPPRPQSGGSDNATDYRQVFLVRVHRLLRLGYERLDRSACDAADEEEISGELGDAIEFVLNDTSSPPWMDFFHVHNEKPVRDPERKGKRRRRLDIRIDSAEQRPRTRFPFEAKRLAEGHGVGTYLGEDGLGRFLRGQYARSEDMAGMLGYVQSGEPEAWAASIGRTLSESPQKYCIVEGMNWQHNLLLGGVEQTYRSSHRRQRFNRVIDIYHTLLNFS